MLEVSISASQHPFLGKTLQFLTPVSKRRRLADGINERAAAKAHAWSGDLRVENMLT